MHEVEIMQYSRMIYDNMYSAISDYFKHMTKMKKASKKDAPEDAPAQQTQ